MRCVKRRVQYLAEYSGHCATVWFLTTACNILYVTQIRSSFVIHLMKIFIGQSALQHGTGKALAKLWDTGKMIRIDQWQWEYSDHRCLNDIECWQGSTRYAHLRDHWDTETWNDTPTVSFDLLHCSTNGLQLETMRRGGGWWDSGRYVQWKNHWGRVALEKSYLWNHNRSYYKRGKRNDFAGNALPCSSEREWLERSTV